MDRSHGSDWLGNGYGGRPFGYFVSASDDFKLPSGDVGKQPKSTYQQKIASHRTIGSIKNSSDPDSVHRVQAMSRRICIGRTLYYVELRPSENILEYVYLQLIVIINFLST